MPPSPLSIPGSRALVLICFPCLHAQGDFVAALLEGVGPALGRPARDLTEYGLGGALDAAARASSAQYDDPDALARLRIRLEPAAASELGGQHALFWLLIPQIMISAHIMAL